MAFSWSVNRDLASWKSLFHSFETELETHKNWLNSEYHSDFERKNAYHPYNFIMPLSFESLSTIIRRGPSELPWIDKKLVEKLTLFYERILSFNSMLEVIYRTTTANPIQSQQLADRLEGLGLKDDAVSEADFLKALHSNKDDLFYLAQSFKSWNYLLHAELIGNKNKDDRLYYLFTAISNDLAGLPRQFNENRPWFIKYENRILWASLIVFLGIVWFF